jgi:hypothetical protein
MDCNVIAISRNNFHISTFCVRGYTMFPFSIVSMSLMHASATLQCSWCVMPPASLSIWFWNSSDCLLPLPFSFAPIMNLHALFRCFRHFDFLNILTMRSNYSLEIFCLNLNIAVPFDYASLTRNRWTFFS